MSHKHRRRMWAMRADMEPLLPFGMGLVDLDPKRWRATGVRGRGICTIDLLIPRGYPFRGPRAVLRTRSGFKHENVDERTNEICLGALDEWSAATNLWSYALQLWSLVGDDGWTTVAAPFKAQLLLCVEYRRLQPNTSHTPASLAALSVDELQAMVDGHPSKQDWDALVDDSDDDQPTP